MTLRPALLMFHRNEPEGVGRTVRALETVCEEIVIIDSSIPAEYRRLQEQLRGTGARIEHVLPLGGTEVLRPLAEGAIRSDWVFSVDADEIVTEALARRVSSVTEGPAAYLVPRYEQSLRTVTWHPRLYRRGRIRYGGWIHEAPTVEGPTVPLRPEERLIHEADYARYLSKENRQRSYLLVESYERPFTGRSLRREFPGPRIRRLLPDSAAPLSRPRARAFLAAWRFGQWLPSSRPILRRRHRRYFAAYLRERLHAFEALSRAEREEAGQIAEELRRAGGPTSYLGLQDPEKVRRLSASVPWEVPGGEVLRGLLCARYRSGTAAHGSTSAGASSPTGRPLGSPPGIAPPHRPQGSSRRGDRSGRPTELPDFRSLDFERLWQGRERTTEVELGVIDELIAGEDVRRILEVGPGGGRVASLLRARAEEHLGIDVTLEFLLRLHARWPTGSDWLAADLVDLPFSSDAISGAVVVRVYNFLVDPVRALVELFRVLAPGGWAIVSYFSAPSAATLWDDVRGRWKGTSVPGTPWRTSFRHETDLPSRARFRREAESVGFSWDREAGVGFEDFRPFRWMPTDLFLGFSHAFGATGLPPHHFVRLRKPGTRPGELPARDTLVLCPVCRGPLGMSLGNPTGARACPRCGSPIPVVEGIPDLRPRGARAISESAPPAFAPEAVAARGPS